MKTVHKIATLLLSVLLGIAHAHALEGSWRGVLQVGPTSLPLVFNFSKTDGTTACTLDSPQQHAFGLAATVAHLSADSLAVSLAALGAQFAGRIAGNQIVGTFTQRGYRFPLTLERERPLTERRPQTPQPPFPYQTIDTVFHSADGTALAGTIVLPADYVAGATPMCVFVTGSGPQDRDEQVFDHRPFAVIADYLGRHGVASLRYDDRGTAASQGDYASATIDTFCADARAALQTAKAYTAGPVGIIGHSEGGTIALLLAQQGIPDFIVTLAAAVSGKETVMDQNRRALQPLGYDDDTLHAALTLISDLLDEVIRQYRAGQPIAIDVEAFAAQRAIAVPEPLMQSLKANMKGANPYFGSLLATDTRPNMGAIACPVLALNGALDTQVDPDANLATIAASPNATTIKLPHLNHLFQHATTGQVSEYPDIPETFAPEALTTILTFLTTLPK